MSVGSGNFTFSFESRFSFTFASGTPPIYYDGMVLEISADDGTSWTDIGALATPGYNGVISTDDSNGGVSTNPLAGRPAYSAFTTSYPTVFTPTTVNLGTSYAGQNVRIRFRIGTDSLGFQKGAEIRNITTSGLTNTPFTAVIPDRALCPAPGEVQNQIWTSNTTMVWDHEASVGAYELYRDLVSTLPGGFGACQQSAIATEMASDASNPPVGAGWFYLVTARNALHEEGTKGFQSSGAPRPNPAPCP